jgi:hypothetical protein
MAESLPPELWLEVFTFLDARDLATVQLTCWTFRHFGTLNNNYIKNTVT